MKLAEFELIERLTRGLKPNEHVTLGAGDDCAVLDLGVPGQEVLFKTDAVVEGVHFTRDACFQRVGRKALARCLSDVAAMGGRPSAALVTLGLADDYRVEDLEALYEGIRSLASQSGVAVVGGETTRNPGGLFVSISLIGLVPKGKSARRSGAKVGDAIFVSGRLGGSMDGKHLDFEPRIEQGSWLCECHAIHSMMDLSDGLAGDLRHILKASGVGAELFARSIPVSLEARRRSRLGEGAKPALLAALTDGEDFELLFTVAARDAVRVLDSWKSRFPEVLLSCIGRVLEGAGLRIRDRLGIRELNAHGYVHFSES